MSDLFDRAELLERVDYDRAFLADTVEMLAADGPALLHEIRQAIGAVDAAGVGRAAHTLKGMIANFCAAGPQAAAFELERMGKAGDLTGAAPALDALESALQSLTADLQAMVRQEQ